MAKLIIRKFGIKTSIILIFINIFTKTTQKQNWNKWKQEHHITSDAITSDQVEQGLVIRREPNAKITFTTAPGTTALIKSTSEDKDSKNLSIDSKEFVYVPITKSISGDIITITYSNLSNSTYTDSKGIDHHIAKIEKTYRDATYLDMLNMPNIPSNHRNIHELIFYSDPTDGFWYKGLNGVTEGNVHFYDENGNLLDIDPGTGYLAITSLNAWYDSPTGTGPFGDSLTGNKKHVETATQISGTKLYALAGSSVSNHNGSLYANETNDSNIEAIRPENTSWKLKGKSWDGKGLPYEYYGSGLASLSGSSYSIRYSTQRDNNDDNYETWVTSTDSFIPQTPTPRTKAHYHYDTNHCPANFLL